MNVSVVEDGKVTRTLFPMRPKQLTKKPAKETAEQAKKKEPLHEDKPRYVVTIDIANPPVDLQGVKAPIWESKRTTVTNGVATYHVVASTTASELEHAIRALLS
jgi:hypothetical protein